jgi:hypothetical protein
VGQQPRGAADLLLAGRDGMSDLSLLLEAPDRGWAEHVQSLIDQALDGRGHLTLGVLGDGLGALPRTSPCFVTGVAICDRPTAVLLSLLGAALRECHVEERELDSGATQVVVRPRRS